MAHTPHSSRSRAMRYWSPYSPNTGRAYYHSRSRPCVPSSAFGRSAAAGASSQKKATALGPSVRIVRRGSIEQAKGTIVSRVWRRERHRRDCEENVSSVICVAELGKEGVDGCCEAQVSVSGG